jgi:hypothetical protein
MILTPILGAIAYSQLSNGERVHGVAKYHSYAAFRGVHQALVGAIMRRELLLGIIILAFPRLARAGSQWAFEKSTLTHHVSHPLHQSDGVGHEARGKGVCHAGQCDFLVAAPVKHAASYARRTVSLGCGAYPVARRGIRIGDDPR